MNTSPQPSPDDLPGLKRFVFPATTGDTPRGTAVLIHGQGDFASRYEAVLIPFRNRGITCFATDFPGHGESEGRRGAVPGFPSVDAIVQSDLARAEALCPGQQPILIGHSVGGLLAMRELLVRPNSYRAAWISSPLIWPEKTRHPILVAILRFLGLLAPGFQLSTGVTESMCRQISVEQQVTKVDFSLFHSRITLGWARDLIDAAQFVRSDFPGSRPDFPILFTQGSADPVCPASLLRAFLDTVTHPGLQYEEFEGILHEPFADQKSPEVFARVGTWLDQLPIPKP